MKPWQDRGEVLDSDEDEPGLGSESQSPGNTGKKARFHDDGHKASESSAVPRSFTEDQASHDGWKDRTGDLEDIDDPDRPWIRSKSVITYSRKTNATAGICDKTIRYRLAEEQEGADGRISTEDPLSPLRQTLRFANDSLGFASPPSGPSGTRSSLKVTINDDDLQYKDQDSGLRADGSSTLSSPLSEREVSPPPPPVFQFPRLGRDIRTEAPFPLENSSQSEDLHDQAVVLEEASTTTTGRRNLRTRNEKQIHPYMFDKAQHQKQFRNHGIRPIRVPHEQEAAESQNMLPSENGSDSEQSLDSRDGQRRWSSPEQEETSHFKEFTPLAHTGTRPGADESDNDLPELRSLIEQPAIRFRSNGIKRRKIAHATSTNLPADANPPDAATSQNQDGFSVPPSPPPTSSNSGPRAASRLANVHFRLPRGLTPDPLPTPQISSDHRAGHFADGDGGEIARETLQRGNIPSKSSNPRLPTIAISSSSESSEGEERRHAEIEDRRLRKERKRIRGVLPASWLKIDFRAQQRQESPSPSRLQKTASSSPPPTMPQKGVARKVFSGRFVSSSQQPANIISDDSGDDDHSHLSRSLELGSPTVDFQRAQSHTMSVDILDDELMEVDWVDPMLAGTSRSRSLHRKHTKRQPKITENFSRQHDHRDDFPGEMNRVRKTLAPTAMAKSKPRKLQHRTSAKRRVARMSIVDAPQHTRSTKGQLPQFVRLAMRRARKQPDQGRHSPSSKFIRLAVKDDTEDAMSVLKQWREGTVAPLKFNQDGCDPRSTFDNHQESDDTLRAPLTEIQHNKQQRLPPPRAKVATSQDVYKRIVPSKSLSKLRQTQLRPIPLREDNFDNTDPNDETSVEQQYTPDENRKRRPRHVPTQATRHRKAQLESLEGEFNKRHRAAAFEHRMNCLTENIIRARVGSASDFHLNRYLFADEPHENLAERVAKDVIEDIALPHRTKKRPTRRIDAEAREFRQPSEPLPDSIELEAQPENPAPDHGPILRGLGPFGTRYATDFDILPLPLGTYFHESSFIGSGDFAASRNFAGRDLDTPTGRIRIHVDGDILEWGAWTEDVAAGLVRIPDAVRDALQTLTSDEDSFAEEETMTLVLSNIDYLLRSTVRYFTQCLAFFDPVDRLACTRSLQMLSKSLLEIVAEHNVPRQHTQDVLGRILQYTTVICRLYVSLCEHPLALPEAKFASHELLLEAIKRLFTQFCGSGTKELRGLYEEGRRAAKLERGLRDTDAAICSIVILQHVTKGIQDDRISFWPILSQSLHIDTSTLGSVALLDRVWYDIFTIQPALEIDEHGILRPGTRLRNNCDDWSIPKQLVKHVLELYQPTISMGGSTINDYVRATFTRCSILVARWGWWRCEPLLGTIFDFYARRNLAQLQREESRGSPRFLNGLYQNPSLEIQAEDTSFHMFLKLLASALQGMKKHGVYPDKKIGAIAWRFIPNHGRTYRKDAMLQQDDLDALRNHHDLLCTLYYAAPSAQRMSPSLIQNLVDHTASHREVCRLNIRAWSNLVNFQASLEEPTGRLDKFMDWFRDIIMATANQYRLARSEVEQEVADAASNGRLQISQNIVEDTIARNQRQIAASIVDALAALKHALESSRTFNAVLHLLSESSFTQVLNIFDPSAHRLRGAVHEILNIATTSIDLQRKFDPTFESQEGSDESQDYGDSIAIQELVSVQASVSSREKTLSDILQIPLATLVSNVFGADINTDDTLLTHIIDSWMQVALITIHNGTRTWYSYIHGYGSDSWSQLRGTNQWRKYTPYFLSHVVEAGGVELDETGILTEWLKSLVEREAMLKFQHKLTSSLLNRYPDERLIHNLPFARNSSGRYDVSMQELRQRRLALLSTVLSNMRGDLDDVVQQQSGKVQELRQRYADMLRRLMQAMKHNYQALQSSSDAEIADVQAQGRYVEFVQQVVTNLQQYSTEICPVDRFFTDSAAFPLPATDPTYVVGRLRSYVPRLSDDRKRKELAGFIQTVSERAVADGHQAYLVDQLVSAMANTVEHGNPKAPSLRHVLHTAIFPAYIENALATACSWILAVPIFQACSKTAETMLYQMVLDDNKSVHTVSSMLSAILLSSVHPIKAAVAHLGRVSLPHVQRLLAAAFNYARSCLTCICHLEQVRGCTSPPGEMMAYFYRCADYIENYVDGSSRTAEMLPEYVVERESDCPWPDTRDYVARQVQEKFNNDWYASDGQYYVRRGRASVEIAVELGDEDKTQLLEALRRFRESFEIIFHGSGRMRQAAQGQFSLIGVMV